jgi:hypothetical protein
MRFWRRRTSAIVSLGRKLSCCPILRAEFLLFFLVLKVPIWKSFFHLKERF